MSGGRPDAAAGERRGEARQAHHRERLLAMVARSPLRSALFWWLFEHHDELMAGAQTSRIGLPWSKLCEGFAQAGLTSLAGGPVKPETARTTWRRVRKEKARLLALEAERLVRRAHDPRNMPSRMRGQWGPPLADRRPEPSAAPPTRTLTPAGVQGAVEMPGGPVLTGGIEDNLPASEFTVIFEGQPLDLRLFMVPGETRPWEAPEFTMEESLRALKAFLRMRLDAWKKDRVSNPYNRVDMEWRKRLGKS